MSRLTRIVALFLVFFLPLTAWGFGWRSRPAPVAAAYYPFSPAVTYSYYPPPVMYVPGVRVIAYEPAPIYVAPSPPVFAPAPVPLTPAPCYAVPAAAPPSFGPLPPVSPPLPPMEKVSTNQAAKMAVPQVSESRAYFNVYPVSPRNGSPTTSDHCRIGFWNHSGRSLVLTVEGQPRMLASGQSISLELPRQFIWKVEGRDPQLERVPPAEAGLEVVIRQ